MLYHLFVSNNTKNLFILFNQEKFNFQSKKIVLMLLRHQSNAKMLTSISHLHKLQEDFQEMDVGGNPVMSQPGAGQATSNMPAFAMPPPSSTNPFANESTNLNTGGQTVYTPGIN